MKEIIVGLLVAGGAFLWANEAEEICLLTDDDRKELTDLINGLDDPQEFAVLDGYEGEGEPLHDY